MNFAERKEQRKTFFEQYVKGWKLRPCTACNGSGYYDNCINGKIPKCSSCKGTGKERYKDYKLKYCEKCIQMTNHLDNICQKCK